MIGVARMLLTAMLASLTALVAGAQPADPEVRLTLVDALSRAQETSHRLGEARARHEGAEAAARLQHAAGQPTVVVSGGYLRTNHIDVFGITQPDGAVRVVYPDIPDNYRSRLEMQWPIYTGGRADALERAARAEAGATERDLSAARFNLRLEVARAYWALVTATESVRLLEAALARADAHLKDVRSQLDVGLIPPNDVLSVEAQRSRQQMLLIEAVNQREASATDLRRLTGLSHATPVAVVESLDPPGAVVGGTDALVAEALAALPERQALTLRVGGTEQRVRAAESARRPTIALTGGVDYANPNPRIFPRQDRWANSWDVAVNVSWPLWDAGRNTAAVAEAAATRTAARERLAEFDSVAAAEVRRRVLDVESSRAVVRASADAVTSAAEARRVVVERFNVGVATSTDVLDALIALLQAELDRTRALANVRLAEARLDRAVGR